MTAPVATAPAEVVDRAGTVASGAWLWAIAGATAMGAVAELVVLRVFTRTIVHIPGASAASPVLSAIAEIGRFAYYLSCVLLAATVVLLVAVSATRHATVGTAALVTFAVAAIGARAGVLGDGSVGVASLAAAVALGAAAVCTLDARPRLPVALFSGAFALGAFDALVSEGVVPVGGSGALRVVSEALAVAAAVTSLLLLRTLPDHRNVALGIAAGIGVVAMLIANSWTTTILMLWNFGLAGTLPWVLYGAAFGALACTLVALVRRADYHRAIGVALLFTGGIGLHSTYQTGLVIAGLALLGSPTSRRGLARPIGAASRGSASP